MPYITAKHHTKVGSVALEVGQVDNASEYMERLAKKYHGTNIQILLVYNFSIYAEYRPVQHTNSVEEFERALQKLAR